MKKFFLFLAVAGLLLSCKDKTSEKKFEVSGKITGNPGSVIYLEEIPAATMQRIIVDSARVGKDGNYTLSTEIREATIYSLRLDQNDYPIASVVNDESKIRVDATFTRESSRFPVSYDVKGSPASQQLKDFMVAFNTKLQSIFINDKQSDSLRQINAPDSMILDLENKRDLITSEIKELLNSTISKSTNPALSLMVLGYYQSTANSPGFKLRPVEIDEVTKIVNDVAAKFPDHQGVASIKKMLDAEAKRETGWVGQTAPEISLPDPNGREVKLSSFKGKYVLVDFWASWCRPCRDDNPNLVRIFNKFKNKNFTILGVSLDRPGQKDNWLKAVREDKLTWTQVSDLMHWNSVVVPVYAISEIPFNVLVDPDGKIIAQALHGEELDAKLSEILK